MSPFRIATRVGWGALIVHLPDGWAMNWFGEKKGEGIEFLDCTPKMRHQVKGRPTLNGEVYGCGPENLQPRSEDRGDAGN
jgi:hypothetical protein